MWTLNNKPYPPLATNIFKSAKLQSCPLQKTDKVLNGCF